jgi:hypothetical protein
MTWLINRMGSMQPSHRQIGLEGVLHVPGVSSRKAKTPSGEWSTYWRKRVTEMTAVTWANGSRNHCKPRGRVGYKLVK